MSIKVKLQGKILGLGLIWGLLTGCASTPQRGLEKLEVGMDKSQVVELMGSPLHSQRQKGQDIWTYRYFKDDQEWFTRVTFKQGRVIDVESTDQATLRARQQLEEASSLEEFEERALRLSPEERSRLLAPSSSDGLQNPEVEDLEKE